MTTRVKFSPSQIISVTEVGLLLKGIVESLIWKESDQYGQAISVSFSPKEEC